MSLETSSHIVACPKCGQPMHYGLVKATFWQGERLSVVEDVPAQICDNCMEQFYDDTTTEAVRRLNEQGFPPGSATREILVSVFSLSTVLSPEAV